MQLVLISGLAGAGKSTALRILEDNQYYCVDNLPPPMLVQLIEMHSLSTDIKKIAVSVDTRSHSHLRQLPNAINELLKLGIDIKIIYLDARVDVLIKRFSETRRKHPLSDKNKTLSDCILEEKEILANISEVAYKIDTSDLTANALRNIIKQFVKAENNQLNVILQSFGFKYGLPIDADFVFDVRCLPNPHYDLSIRNFTGREEPIMLFLDQQSKVQDMLSDINEFITKWLPSFSMDNRNYITIAIGCTGGKHRSVYIVEKLAMLIGKNDYKVMVRHREL